MKLAPGIVIVLAGVACGDSKSGDAKSAQQTYLEKTRRTEAELSLRAIERAAKAHFVETAAFPVGSAGPTPAKPCCEGPDRTCPVEPSQWQAGVWEQLYFESVEPHRFQYAYQGTAETFTARAIGDLDCDGITIEFVLEGRAEHGAPVFTLTQPERPD
jgi:hypothetical protein